MIRGFHIRLAAPEDAEAILGIYKHYVKDTAVTFDVEVPSLDIMQDRIAFITRNYPFLLAYNDDELLGYAYADFFRQREAYIWSAECSIYISPNSHRKGVGRALYERLEELLRIMGVRNLYACIAYSDSPDEHLSDSSIRFHEKMGFVGMARFPQCACKFGKWYGVLWMEKTIGDHSENPERPKPFFWIAPDYFVV